MRQVVGIGAGGHAKVVMDILRLSGEWEIVGLLDANPALWGTEILGIPVLGDDSRLSELYNRGVRHAFIGVGTAGESRVRETLYAQALDAGFDVAAAVHPRAVIAASAALGRGVTVMAQGVVNPAARVGDNVIVNTGAIVEHDCVIGDHAHVATGARLAGGVTLGAGAHVGIGASVRQGICIGCRALVGAGAVVVGDVPEGAVVVGVPARVVRKVQR